MQQTKCQANRAGDSNRQSFKRCGRFYCRAGKWYFKSREDLVYGPFNNKSACKYAFNEFIELVSNNSNFSNAIDDNYLSNNKLVVTKIEL